MISLELVQRIWSLIPQPKPGHLLDVWELGSITNEGIGARFVVDHEMRRHLLIPAPYLDEPIEDKRSSGVHLVVAKWGDEGTSTTFVDLICLKSHLNDLFDLIIYEVLEELDNSEIRPDRACITVLNRWRELLARETTLVPSRSEIIGLFGELTILRTLVEHNQHAITSWIGPDRGRYDFFAGGNALEVKTTTQRQRLQLTINGLDQLLPPIYGTLHLAVLQLEETPRSGESLHSIIESLIKLGVDSAAIYQKTSRLGFTPNIIGALRELQFSVVKQSIYLVDEDFPRITDSSFLEATPPCGVIEINYVIDITFPPPHPLSDAAEEIMFANLLGGLR